MEAQTHEIPSPHADDDEDVSWALSTATALWASGERAEALKWLRRAAETASDNNADSRALELFKAAAEVATKLASTPPPSSARPTTPGSVSQLPGPPSTAPGPASTAPAAAAPSSAARAPSAGPPPPPAAPRSVAPRTPTQRPSAAAPPPAGEPRSRTAPPPRSSSDGRITALPESAGAPATQAARRDARPAPAPSSGGAATARVPATKRTDAPPAPIPGPAPIPTGLGPRLDPHSRSLEPKRDPRPRSLEPAAAARSAPARVRPRPPLDRRPPDDEVTLTRDFNRQLASMAAGDDEETNVLSGGATDGGVRLSASRGGVGAAHDARPTELAPPIQDEPTGSSAGPYDQATPTDLPGANVGSPWPGLGQGSGRALTVLPALRVVVLATSVAGEVRLMALAPGSQAPTGAAVATLVPATEEDADAIVRLFDSTR